MFKFISYLDRHRWVNLILAAVYYIIVVTTHQKVGRLVATTLDKPLGRETYNLIVMVAAIVLGLVFLLPLYKGFKEHLSKSEKRKVIIYFFYTLLLIIISINLIMVVNVELIHVFQYCVMAILIFPFFKNFNTTLFFATILGALDEAYQYFILFPEKSNYFDFNDVIINMLGVCLGLVFVRSQGIKTTKTYASWYKSPIFISIVLITGTFLLAYLTKYVGVMPDKEGDIKGFTLIRRYIPGFWRKLPPEVLFHIIRPLEFLVVFPLLFLSFVRLGASNSEKV